MSQRRLFPVAAVAMLLAVPALAGPDLILRKIEIRDVHGLKIFVSNNGDQGSGAFAVRVSVIDAGGKVLRALDEHFSSIDAHQFHEADLQIDLAGAARVVAVADIDRSVNENDETNNVRSAEIPASVASKGQKVIKVSKPFGAASSPLPIGLPPSSGDDLAVTGITFSDAGGKDRVVVVISNVGNVAWKEAKRTLTLKRTVMTAGGAAQTTTVDTLAALPDLAPGESWARAFDRPPKASGATSYTWEATLAPGDGNPANDHFALKSGATKFD